MDKHSSLFVEHVSGEEENLNKIFINITKCFSFSQALPTYLSVTSFERLASNKFSKLGCLRGLIGIKRSSLFVECVSDEEEHFN